jgi:CHAT domain-containing protein
VIKYTGEIYFRQVDLKSSGVSLKNLVIATRQSIGVKDRAEIEVAYNRGASLPDKESQISRLRRLYDILVEPIAEFLPKDPNHRIIFIPQDEILLVPFSALLNSSGKSLIENYTILTAPSIQLSELIWRRESKKVNQLPISGSSALVVGNPEMPKVPTEDKYITLPELPGTEQEAREIANIFGTEALVGKRASKTEMVKKMSTARLIHLATHGLEGDFNGSGFSGAIALAPDENGQANDGLLTADEISDLSLNADLVVLSACNTGKGNITREGVLGLSRSFIFAGVPSVIVSLWKVPDESTAFLMAEFYKNWKERKLDKAQALRQAMLTTRDKYPQPLDWAAFTLIGEAE